MRKDVFGHEIVQPGTMLLLPGDTKLYGRKSTKNDRSQRSLGDQREAAFETAEEYNIAVTDEDWYEEEAGHGGDEWWEGGGESGLEGDLMEPARTRPMFTRLMRGVQAGTVKCIIVWSLDRLWRSAEICSKAINIMGKRGCLLMDRNGFVDISSPEGRESVLINAVNAQSQREHTAANCGRGVTKQRAKGKMVGNCNSLGFRSAGPKSGEVRHIPEEHEMVRRIFRMFYAGEDARGPLTPDQIRLQLKGEGFVWTPDLHDKRAVKRSPETREQIYDQQIRRMLQDIRYIGKQRHDGKEWDCPAFLFNGEPIVPLELFTRVQEKIGQQSTGSKSSRNKYALTGRMRCGLCGQALTVQTTQRRGLVDGSDGLRRYWMPREGRGYTWCDHTLPNIRLDVLDVYIDKTLAPLMLAEIQERGLDDEALMLAQEQAALQRELCEAERHYREELPKYHRRKIDPELLESIQEDAKNEIARLRGELRLVMLKSTKMRDIVPALQDITTVPDSVRRDALRAVIRWIAVLPSDGLVAMKGRRNSRPKGDLGTLVVLTAWGTYHTVQLFRDPSGERSANATQMRPAAVSEAVGGVADFPDPKSFHDGLERSWKNKKYEWSARDVTPGYTPAFPTREAEFDAGDDAV